MTQRAGEIEAKRDELKERTDVKSYFKQEKKENLFLTKEAANNRTSFIGRIRHSAIHMKLMQGANEIKMKDVKAESKEEQVGNLKKFLNAMSDG